MKIIPFPQISVISNRVKERDGDKQEGAGQNSYESMSQEQRNTKSEDAEPVIEVTDESINQAIEALNHDVSASQNGLHAEPSGSGPGLRVVLKDASGGVLRNVSGEEFLKLREAIGQNKRPGKLIDHKA
jgi:hypothetical protein